MKIELQGVTKRFRRFCALDDATVIVEQGQIMALLGSNGAGKTTMLRCLAGILGPDKGALLFDGQPFNRNDLDLRRRIFFLPDFPIAFEQWTVVRHIAMVMRLYNRATEEDGERVIELLRDFDMLPLAEMPYHTLSRGQRYKAALVALLSVDPALWLIDEPFASGMDPHGLKAFRRHAQAAADRGATIIYSTQILEVVESFSDRICVIHKGQIRAFDTMEHLRTNSIQGVEALDEIFQQLRMEDAE